MDPTTVDNGDGTTTTTWDDGTTRTDYADGSSMTSYPDGRVLNVYPDGTRTLNDQYGTALDPDTGLPLGVDPGPVTEEQIPLSDYLDGVHALPSLGYVAGLIAGSEMVLAVAEVADGLLTPVVMAIEVWRALDSAPRAYGTMGYCYGLMYGALDQGEPAYPVGPWSIDSDETVAEKRQRFAEGVAEAGTELADGANGTAKRNRILLRTAYLGSDARATLNEIWQAMCANQGDDFYRDHFRLSWPDTGMVGA
jgi:hypothetical protein